METNKQSTFTTDVGRKILAGLNYLSEDERYMRRALKSVNQLVAEKRKEATQEPCCFSVEELCKIVEESQRARANGYKGIPSQKVFAELEKEFPYLCN